MVGYGYGYRTIMVGYGYGYITIITIITTYHFGGSWIPDFQFENTDRFAGS